MQDYMQLNYIVLESIIFQLGEQTETDVSSIFFYFEKCADEDLLTISNFIDWLENRSISFKIQFRYNNALGLSTNIKCLLYVMYIKVRAFLKIFKK